MVAKQEIVADVVPHNFPCRSIVCSLMFLGSLATLAALRSIVQVPDAPTFSTRDTNTIKFEEIDASQLVLLALSQHEFGNLCLTVESTSSSPGESVILSQCNGKDERQQFVVDNRMIRWNSNVDMCLSAENTASSRTSSILVDMCNETDQSWLVAESRIHATGSGSQCIGGSVVSGLRAVLGNCSKIPQEAQSAWKCYTYGEGEDNSWCRHAGVHHGQEIQFFGEDSTCGECWCCQRPYREPSSNFSLAIPKQVRAVEVEDTSEGPWSCYTYNEGEDEPWCRHIGVLHGFEYRFFGTSSPCGDCWCCRRARASTGTSAAPPEQLPSAPPAPQQGQGHEGSAAEKPSPWSCYAYGDGQDNYWCMIAGTRNGVRYKFFGPGGPCGDCWCCQQFDQVSSNEEDEAVGGECSQPNEDCTHSKACCVQGMQCYTKNTTFAACRPICQREEGWSCEMLGTRAPQKTIGSLPGEDCLLTKRCNNDGLQCFLKDKTSAYCRASAPHGWDGQVLG